MTVTVTPGVAGFRVVTITYTGPTQKVVDTLELFAESIYTGSDWASLTSQEKLDMVDAYIKRTIVDRARQLHADKQAKIAAEQARNEDKFL